jgi:hypothetical protein
MVRPRQTVSKPKIQPAIRKGTGKAETVQVPDRPDIDLRNVPRGQIAENVWVAVRNLGTVPKNYKGPCKLFKEQDGGFGDSKTYKPVCAGQCPGTCKVVRIETEEGDHSDLYRVMVFCTCK